MEQPNLRAKQAACNPNQAQMCLSESENKVIATKSDGLSFFPCEIAIWV